VTNTTITHMNTCTEISIIQFSSTALTKLVIDEIDLNIGATFEKRRASHSQPIWSESDGSRMMEERCLCWYPLFYKTMVVSGGSRAFAEEWDCVVMAVRIPPSLPRLKQMEPCITQAVASLDLSHTHTHTHTNTHIHTHTCVSSAWLSF